MKGSPESEWDQKCHETAKVESDLASKVIYSAERKMISFGNT